MGVAVQEQVVIHLQYNVIMKFQQVNNKSHNVCDICGKQIPYISGILDEGVSVDETSWNKLKEALHLPSDKGFLCYECMFKNLYKLGIDPFEVMVESPHNNILWRRMFLETENLKYEWLSKSKRHRLTWIPNEENFDKEEPFKMEFSSFGDVIKFSDWLERLLYPPQEEEEEEEECEEDTRC